MEQLADAASERFERGDYARASVIFTPEWRLRLRQLGQGFVEACLDVLLRDPAERDLGDLDEDSPVADAIDRLCSVTVAFGRG